VYPIEIIEIDNNREFVKTVLQPPGSSDYFELPVDADGLKSAVKSA
jgi:hypothetical protein